MARCSKTKLIGAADGSRPAHCCITDSSGRRRFAPSLPSGLNGRRRPESGAGCHRTRLPLLYWWPPGRPLMQREIMGRPAKIPHPPIRSCPIGDDICPHPAVDHPPT